MMVHRQIAIIKVRPGASKWLFILISLEIVLARAPIIIPFFLQLVTSSWDNFCAASVPPTNISILARVKINDELVPRQDKRLKSSIVSEKKKRMREKRHWWNSFKNNKAHNSRCGLEKILNGFWNSWNGLWFGLWWLLSMHKMTIKKSKIEQ